MHRGKRVPHGHGRATETHREYVGEWRFGHRDGFGRNTNTRGSVYEGEWIDNDPHGQGQVWYRDGGHYKGTFRAGLPHGRGVAKWGDGHVDDGEWAAGIFQQPTSVSNTDGVKALVE